MTKLIPDEEMINRPLKELRMSASASFTKAEVNGLDEIFNILLRGGDARTLARSVPMKKVLCKVLVMKEAIERQTKRREMKAYKAVTNFLSEHQQNADELANNVRHFTPTTPTLEREECSSCGETFDASEQQAFDPKDNDHCPKCGGRDCITTAEEPAT